MSKTGRYMSRKKELFCGNILYIFIPLFVTFENQNS